MTQPRSIILLNTVTVGTDEYSIKVSVTRQTDPEVDRDMETIKAQIQAGLEAWIVPKIESGNP